jgi:1,4-dihydroxy-2-naphthoate octaprenyltransferase
VLVGTGAAVALGGFRPVPALLALVVALALQVAVNYANDYSDGRRGADADRVGPMRLVGSGAATPRQVLVAAVLAFAVAAVAGLALAALSSWWLVAAGAVCIAAAWTYTGGPLPYGYRALGEVFVFVFFGPVAVVGTVFVQTGTLPGLAFAVAVPVGLLIVAILVVNNLRDIQGDELVGKRTLAVLLGERATRLTYTGLLAGAFVVVAAVGIARPWALLGLLAAPLAVPPARTVLSGGRGPALIGALQGTGLLTLVTGILLGAGLALSG